MMLFYRCRNWDSERLNDLPKRHITYKWQSHPSSPCLLGSHPWLSLLHDAILRFQERQGYTHSTFSPPQAFSGSTGLTALVSLVRSIAVGNPHLTLHTFFSWESLLLTWKLREEGSSLGASLRVTLLEVYKLVHVFRKVGSNMYRKS